MLTINANNSIKTYRLLLIIVRAGFVFLKDSLKNTLFNNARFYSESRILSLNNNIFGIEHVVVISIFWRYLVLINI